MSKLEIKLNVNKLKVKHTAGMTPNFMYKIMESELIIILEE